MSGKPKYNKLKLKTGIRKQKSEKWKTEKRKWKPDGEMVMRGWAEKHNIGQTLTLYNPDIIFIPYAKTWNVTTPVINILLRSTYLSHDHRRQGAVIIHIWDNIIYWDLR